MTQSLTELFSKIESLLNTPSHCSLYDENTHRFMIEQCVQSKLVVCTPLEKTLWSEHFIQLQERYRQTTTAPFCYSAYYGVDVVEGRMPTETSLYAGVALSGNDLFRSTFFVSNGVAIDPIADIHNVAVDCYVGIMLSVSSIQHWIKNRERDKHLLEIHVEKLKPIIV